VTNLERILIRGTFRGELSYHLQGADMFLVKVIDFKIC